jgi:hypothetical protein
MRAGVNESDLNESRVSVRAGVNERGVNVGVTCEQTPRSRFPFQILVKRHLLSMHEISNSTVHFV